MTAKIAKENLGRIYYGATGMRPPMQGFNTTDLLHKSFNANLVVEEKPKQDGSGNFKSAKLNGIAPLGNAAPVQNNNQPTQQPMQQNQTAPWSK